MSLIESIYERGAPSGRRAIAEVPITLTEPTRRGNQFKEPQERLDSIWAGFTTRAPGKVTNIIPKKSHAGKTVSRAAKESAAAPDPGRGIVIPAETSYEAARALCVAKVTKIVKECRRINQKYRDAHFDLELDLKKHRRFCLESLDNRIRRREIIVEERRRGDNRSSDSDDELPPSPQPPPPPPPNFIRDRDWPPGSRFKPQSVKRVHEIFDDPKFFIEGPTANDVRQGRDGDCWLMAALCTMSNKPGLIEKICVAQDEAVGVYGFVFYRDGEWFSEIIDDKLYLIKADYDDVNPERMAWEDLDRINAEETYRKAYQSNSSALYFAQCENPNETWLPLLEKAYAKAHGDYAALHGGHMGEGIEDLTGGVASELFTTDILDKEYFWKEELMKVNTEFLFGCSTGMWGSGWGNRRGIMECHAYSVMRAVEIDGQRLVLLKNPWGKGEWKGPWSDGSKEWTPEWLQKLGHRFGDDGAFWISFEDLLRKYQVFDRTRLFGPEWKVGTVWTTLNIPWMLEYHDTKFAFTISKPGPVVIALSQLDNRYFRGLEGEYRFRLSFRLHEAGEEDYLVRSQTPYYMTRSVNVELDLDPGEYHVLVRVDAFRRKDILPVEEVVREHTDFHREKLTRLGLSYDFAHAKGKIVESAEDKAARKAYETRKREKVRKEITADLTKFKEKRHKYMARDHEKRAQKLEKRKIKERARIEKRKEEEFMEFQRIRKERDESEKRPKESDDLATLPTDRQATCTEEDAVPRLESNESFSTAREGIDDAYLGAGPREETPRSMQLEDVADVPLSLTGLSLTKPPTGSDSFAWDGAPGFPPTALENKRNMLRDSPPGTPWNRALPREGAARASRREREFSPAPPRRAATMNAGPSVRSRTNQPHRSDRPDSVFEPLPPSRSATRAESPGPIGPQGRMPNPGLRGPPASERIRDRERERGYFVPPSSAYPRPPRGEGAAFPVMRFDPESPRGQSRHRREFDDDARSLSSMSDVSERDIAERIDEYDRSRRRANLSPHTPPPPQPFPQPFSSDGRVLETPWNAVATLGLRVYYQASEEDEARDTLKLRVLRPNPYELSDDEDKGDGEDKNGGEGEGKGNNEEDEKADEASILDMDDAAKDAALGGDEKLAITVEGGYSTAELGE